MHIRPEIRAPLRRGEELRLRQDPHRHRHVRLKEPHRMPPGRNVQFVEPCRRRRKRKRHRFLRHRGQPHPLHRNTVAQHLYARRQERTFRKPQQLRAERHLARTLRIDGQGEMPRRTRPLQLAHLTRCWIDNSRRRKVERLAARHRHARRRPVRALRRELRTRERLPDLQSAEIDALHDRRIPQPRLERHVRPVRRYGAAIDDPAVAEHDRRRRFRLVMDRHPRIPRPLERAALKLDPSTDGQIVVLEPTLLVLETVHVAARDAVLEARRHGRRLRVQVSEVELVAAPLVVLEAAVAHDDVGGVPPVSEKSQLSQRSPRTAMTLNP